MCMNPPFAQHNETCISRTQLNAGSLNMIRVCPKRDAICPHGMMCPYAVDRYSCKPEPKIESHVPEPGSACGYED
jgi:hypothetical protein